MSDQPTENPTTKAHRLVGRALLDLSNASARLSWVQVQHADGRLRGGRAVEARLVDATVSLDRAERAMSKLGDRLFEPWADEET